MVQARTTLFTLAAALLCAPVSVQAACNAKLSQGFNASGSATATLLGSTFNFTRYVSYETGSNNTLYEPITVSSSECVPEPAYN